MCHQSWNYIFYFEFPVHALMVKQGIAKGNFFCNLHDGLHGDPLMVCKDLSCLHSPFHIETI
jgi:hypothetical protein